MSNENGGTNICVNMSEIRVPPPSEFLIFGIYGCKGITTYKQKSKFQRH